MHVNYYDVLIFMYYHTTVWRKKIYINEQVIQKSAIICFVIYFVLNKYKSIKIITNEVINIQCDELVYVS